MLKNDDILAIIASELSQSDPNQIVGDNQLTLEGSLDYYLGNPNGTEIEGRSKIVSTDIADAIEWIMPQIMKSFTQNNEIVIFDPVHEGDEKQAELESEYVYEVLMKQNDGFIILHQFVKDALMQRNGILKVYYAKNTHETTNDYTGVTETQLQMLLQDDAIDIVEMTEGVNEQGMPIFDIKLLVTREEGKIYIESIPPEEFRVNSNHNSICLNDARFTAHVTQKTASELIEEYGLSKAETEELPAGDSDTYANNYRFNLQGSQVFYGDNTEDASQRLIEVSECFMKIDIDETGIAKLMKITTVGGDDNPTEILSVEAVEDMPWVSTTAFLMSHKFQGLSISDRLKQLQDQKTAIWRSMLDNMYLQNNQRNVVLEGSVNLDDLLVSRPGGIIRAKRLDAITPLITPQLGQDAYNMLEYLDRVRAGRTGVDPDGSATPASVGDRVGSQGVDRLMNAKEELVGLIIRVIAETGIKPLCVKIRDLAITHLDAVRDFQFRGTWYEINPSQWRNRTSTTVRVGTGTGNHTAKLAAISQVLAFQQTVLQNPQQSLIKEQQVFTALDDFCKFSGLNGATRYFLDPTSPEGQQFTEENQKASADASAEAKEIEQTLAQAQMALGAAEMEKAKAQMTNVQMRAENDMHKNMLQLEKQQNDTKIAALKLQLDEAKAIVARLQADEKLELDYNREANNLALELTRIEATTETEQNENFRENKNEYGE